MGDLATLPFGARANLEPPLLVGVLVGGLELLAFAGFALDFSTGAAELDGPGRTPV